MISEQNSIASNADQPALRILMIAPTSFFADYGCHVRILEETRVLQQMGHAVTVAAYRNGGDVEGVEIERTLPIPWRREYEVGSSRHKIAFDLLLGLKILALLLRRRYDVIHAHLHEGALIALVLGKLFGIPVVFDFQGSLTEEMIDHRFLARDSWIYRPLRRLEEWINRKPAAIFTSSKNAEQLLIDQFGCPAEKIQPLPDCVNTDVFRPAEMVDVAELEELRQRYALPADGKVIVYLGLLAEYQGISHLLQATARLLADQRNVTLLLMGFPGVEFYQAKAVELGIAHRVRFTGRIPYADAPRHIALGDVAAAPKLSLTEGSGKLLNYMAVALPTVAFDTPVAREYLGSHGILAERGSVESLTAKLDAILFGDADPAAIGQRLRKRALARFEWRNAGVEIVRTYRHVVGGGRGKNNSPHRLTRLQSE